RVRSVIGSVEVDKPAPQDRLFADCAAAKAPQCRLHRVDLLAGFGRHSPLGDDPQPAFEFHRLVRQQSLHGDEQIADSILQSGGELCTRFFSAWWPGAAPDDATNRYTAFL